MRTQISIARIGIGTALLAMAAGTTTAATDVAAKNAPSPWNQGTPEEIAAIRATFVPQIERTIVKTAPEAPARPERKLTPWEAYTPQVGEDLRSDPLPQYSLYKGRPVVMTVDTTRIAVKFAGLAAEGGDDQVKLAAAKLGVSIEKIDSPGVGNWRFLSFGKPLAGKGAVEAVIQALLADGAFEFASPVFDHPTIKGGYVVITPEVNVRVWMASLADAEDTITKASTMGIATRGLGELPGAFQLRGAERDGFKVLREANRLAEQPGIAWSEPDTLSTMSLELVPNDPGWSNSGNWGWSQASDIDTDADLAWDLTRGRPSIQVLVMDCGVEQNHPDINQNAGRDFTTGAVGGVAGGGPSGSCDRHGTSVAGIIAGMNNNGIGGSGVCPNCRVISAKTATEQSNPCSSSYAAFSGSWLANALAWGLSQGAQISNSSFGVGQSSTIDNAYDNAANNGMIHFGAAGNGGADQIGDPALIYPASEASVTAVTSIDFDGNRSGFANWGTGLQFACPGSNVYTCDRQSTLGYNGSAGTAGDYTSFGGTSAATPFCSGIAALVWSAKPALGGASVLSLMRTSCRDLGAAGYDTGYGWGFPNANTALRLFSANDWCDTATTITSFAYAPATFSTTGFNEVSDEPQESCEFGNNGVSHTVWYRFVPPCSGTIDVNTAGSSYDTVLAVFSGSCASPSQVACSDDINGTLQSQVTGVAVAAGQTYLNKVSAYGLSAAGGDLSFHFAYTATAPANDMCGSSTVIPTYPYTTTACTVGADNQVCESQGTCVPVAAGTSHSVWYQYTAPVTGKADIDTNGSGYDTVLTVWNGCPLGILVNGNVACISDGGMVACDDDGGFGLQSALSGVVMRKGNTYKIKVAAYNATTGVGGDMALHFNYHPCPADYNADGVLSVQDIFDFLSGWFSGNALADFNSVGGISVQDIFDFLAAWFAGC